MGRQPPKASSRLVRQVLKTCRTIVVALLVISVTTNLLMLTGPLYMLQVYDRVLTSGSVPTLVALSILAVLAYLCLGLLESIRTSLSSRIASGLETRLNDSLLLPLTDAARGAGAREALQRVRDIRLVRQFLSSPVPGAILDLPWTPIFVLVIFFMHPWLGAVAVAGGGILILIAVANEALSRQRAQETQSRSQTADAAAQDVFENIEIFTALGMRQRMIERWRMHLDGVDRSALISGDRMSGFSAATKAFRLFLQSAILGFGAFLALQGDLSSGSMVAASIIMGRALAPVELLVGQWRSVINARSSWVKLRLELEQTVDAEPTMVLPQPKGALRVESLFVAPPGSEAEVIRNVSFEIGPGAVLAVIGPSASGKTSLGKALMGLWPAMSGCVRLDGADLTSWNPDRLGPHIGYLPQDVCLSEGSIAQNISRMDPQADPEDIIAAAEVAACHDMILKLKDGYDTQIGPKGHVLSAGQRQRIGLARAVFGKPVLLVLDEPNSNLDSHGDAALASALETLRASGSTVVAIAHRPSVVTLADKVLVLENGTVRAFGSPESVVGRGRVSPISEKRAGGGVV